MNRTLIPAPVGLGLVLLAGLASAGQSVSVESGPVSANFNTIEVIGSVLRSEDVRLRSRAVELLATRDDPRAVALLVRAAEDADVAVRRAAVEALGRKGGSEAVGAMVKAVSDSDESVRAVVLATLLRWGEPSTAAAAIAAASDAVPRHRVVAAQLLGALGAGGRVNVAEPLMRLVEDSSVEVRIAAVPALAGLTDPRVVASLFRALGDDDVGVREKAKRTIEEFGERVTPESLSSVIMDSRESVRLALVRWVIGRKSEHGKTLLVKALGDSSSRIRIEGARGLVALWDASAVEPLLVLVRDEVPGVREAALKGLGNLGDSRAVPAAILALADDHAEVREAARQVVEALGGKASVEIVLPLVKESREVVRAEALRLIGRLGGEAARSALLGGLADTSDTVRAIAVGGLGGWKDPALVEPLLARLSDRAEAVRQAAGKSLVQVGTSAIGPLCQALGSVGEPGLAAVTSVLVRLGKDSIPPLIDALGRAAARPVAAATLERLGDPIGSLLVRALEGQGEAAETLRQGADARLVPLLLRIVREEEAAVRVQTIRVLGQLQDAKASLALNKALVELGDTEAPVTLAAIEVFGRWPSAEAVEYLLGVVGDAGMSVRSEASSALRSLRGQEGLRRAFVDGASVSNWMRRQRALRFLVRGDEEGPSRDLAQAMATVVLSPSSLGWTGGLLAASGIVALIGVREFKPRRVPGPAGWVVVMNLLVVAGVYPGAVAGTWGSAVFLGVVFVPAWMALVWAGTVGPGQWLAARRRSKGFVCRHHYHRCVPGPRLGWLERWSGRWLVRCKGSRMGVSGLAADMGCRAQGCVEHYNGVRQVVAVLEARLGPPAVEPGGGVLRVNWMRYRKPLDFDAVEIGHVPDTEVEAFLREFRYAPEKAVRDRLRTMDCVVRAEAGLEEKTMRSLGAVFGRVITPSTSR